MAATKPPALLKSASLTPTLLARKGGARPALRPQAPELAQVDNTSESPEALATSQSGAKVVSLSTIRKAAPAGKRTVGKANPVRRQRERLAERLTGGLPAKPAPRAAAFTLRLDAERHLALRLASALSGRSAQKLVVDALDSMLANLPDVAELAIRAGKQR